jgi:hypothetical protein
MKDGKPLKGVIGYFQVFFGVLEKEGFVGDSPQEGYVYDRIGKGASVDLGYIGDLAGKVFRTEPADVSAVVEGPSFQGPEEPDHHLDEGGLTTAVRSEEGDDLAPLYDKTDAGENRFARITEINLFDLDKRI